MKNKHAAMEMSVGTLVVIVLSMTVLILGIFLVQKIFGGATDAVDNINNQVISELNKAYADETIKLAVFPVDRTLSLKRADDPKGFAFDVRNKDVKEAKFDYTVYANDVSKCGGLTKEQANNFLIGGTGSFILGPGDRIENLRLVKYSIPDGTPPCTITYVLEVKKEKAAYSSADIFVTIK